MRNFSLLVLITGTILSGGSLSAQTRKVLSIEDACIQAVANYPATQQKAVYDVQARLAIEQLNKNYLPQLNLSGQASYQSEVTKIQIPLPNFSISPLDKDQYKLVADVNQLIYDGGVLASQKKLQQLQYASEKQKIEIELFRLKDKVRQLYMGILWMDAQLQLLTLVEKDLSQAMDKIAAQLTQGTSTRTALNLLTAEKLKISQRKIEVNSGKLGWMESLKVWIPFDDSNEWTFVWPKTEKSRLEDSIIRPELYLYQMQQALLKEQNRLNHIKNLPKAGAFIQGGYGRPGLNFLKNEFSPFYIAGIRLNWSLSGFYTQKQEAQQIQQQSKQLSLQEQSFLMGTQAQLKQQAKEVDKYDGLIEMDHEIIALKEQILGATKVQLEQGLITANDYVRELNALDQARQQLIAHQIQAIQARINYETLRGE